MPQLSFKIHDYTGYDYATSQDVEYCIGGPGLNAEYVNMCIAQANGQECEFDISSVGGDLKAGIDMFDAIKAYGKADTRIGAMAASSAGLVAMAGRTVTMSKYGLLMLHKPMTGSGGNADDLLNDVQMLNIMQSRIAQIYMDKTGLDEVTINSLINSVTWLTADQALDLGFIDAIEDYSAEVVNHALVSKFAHTAPVVYQRVFNKLQIENQMTKEEKDALEKKNTGVLQAVFNWFKKSQIKSVTDKGTIVSMAALNVGTSVTDEAGEDMPDGDYTMTNAEGKQVKMKIKNSVVDEMECEKEDDSDTVEDIANATVLNSVNIKVTNKAEAGSIAKVITNQVNQINALNAKLIEVTNQLTESNAAVLREETAIRDTIKSEFTPDGSKRADKSKVAGVTNQVAEFVPASPAAKKAYEKAIANIK